MNELTDIQYNNTLEEYYPFGDSSLRTFTKKRYRYVGKEKDAESGLYYYGARYYSPWTCRFVSVDPLADKYAQLSPYNYADNNPVGDLDVDGMQNTGTEETKTSENNGNANEEIPDFAVGTTLLEEAVVYGYKIGGFSDYNKNDSLSLSNYDTYSFADYEDEYNIAMKVGGKYSIYLVDAPSLTSTTTDWTDYWNKMEIWRESQCGDCSYYEAYKIYDEEAGFKAQRDYEEGYHLMILGMWLGMMLETATPSNGFKIYRPSFRWTFKSPTVKYQIIHRNIDSKELVDLFHNKFNFRNDPSGANFQFGKQFFRGAESLESAVAHSESVSGKKFLLQIKVKNSGLKFNSYASKRILDGRHALHIEPEGLSDFNSSVQKIWIKKLKK